MGMSLRAYARHRGVTDSAVHKAVRTGRITPDADGCIDAERADREWILNSGSRVGTQFRAERIPLQSDERGDGAMPSGGASGPSLNEARTYNEVVKAQTNKVRLARLKGDLVDRPQAIAHVFKLARAERDAWLNWPARVSAQMAVALGVSGHAMHVALEAAVREHLLELGQLQPRVD